MKTILSSDCAGSPPQRLFHDEEPSLSHLFPRHRNRLWHFPEFVNVTTFIFSLLYVHQCTLITIFHQTSQEMNGKRTPNPTWIFQINRSTTFIPICNASIFIETPKLTRVFEGYVVSLVPRITGLPITTFGLISIRSIMVHGTPPV